MTDPTSSQPPAVPAASTESTVAPAVTPAPAKGRGLGRFALVLGILAFLGDIGVLIFAVAQIAAFAQNFDYSQGLAALAGFAVLAFIAFWAGIIVGGLAVLLGLIAAITNRGRASGIVGLILGLLVVISHLTVGLGILGAGSGLSNLGS